MSINKNIKKSDEKVVITVRIDKELDESLNIARSKTGLSKADIIRNYLNLSNYVFMQKGSIKSLDNRELIIFKRSFLKNLLKDMDEVAQIILGEKLARFINDIARIQRRINDLSYKLDICENLGFFPKFIDQEDYILISNKFGPRKFIEAFTWKLITEKDFNRQFVEAEISKNPKSTARNYKKEIAPVERLSSHYAFEFAKLPKKE